ncbi:unnamed protein product, partial [Diamesa tonsa]
FPHHLPGLPSTTTGHLSGTPDWRVLNNRPFPPSQYFHHHPHFTPHNMLAAIDRLERPFLDTNTTAQSQSKFPKTSPDINSSTKITDISSSSLKDDDLDYDDEDTENISVTGSPDISCINELENQQDNKRESGAFTSIIQKSQRKTEFNPSFPVNSNLAASNPMHHALAAHLFFQNPLLPPPNQWLYNHLYNNYHDFPCPDLPRDPIISKRKRSSSVESITIPNENINDSNRKSENFNSRNRMSQAVKSSDVWRPY